MSKRVCAESGCPTLVEVGTRDGRCDTHRRARDRERGTTGQRGYGSTHAKLRARWQRRLDAGEVIYCWRCRTRGVLTRIDPRAWHLGHDDEDRSVYRGPECVGCNTATASRRISPGA